MKVHKHDDSTRVTIPKEIIKSRGWENQTYFIFLDDGEGMIGLSPIAEAEKFMRPFLLKHGELSTTKTH